MSADAPQPTVASLSVESSGVSWVRVRASRILSRVGLAIYLASTIFQGVAMGTLRSSSKFGMALFATSYVLALMYMAAFVASFVLWFWRSAKPGTVHVQDQTVTLEGVGRPARSFQRAEVRSALVTTGPAGTEVHLEHESGDLSIVRPVAPQAAYALVRALGFGPGGKSTHISMSSPQRRWLHPVFGWVSAQISTFTVVMIGMFIAQALGDRTNVGALITYPLSALTTLGLYHLAKRLFRPWELTIGDDGVRYAVGRKERFVRRADLQGVEYPYPGAPVTVHAGPHTFRIMGMGLDEAKRRAAAELLHATLQRTARAPGREAPFDAAAASASAVRARFRQMFDDGNYRNAGVSAEDALAALESPTATPEQRVGAAVALRVRGEDPVRIRVASEALADESTREALMAIADDAPDAVVDRALNRMRQRR
jgi:hypothetical protein